MLLNSDIPPISHSSRQRPHWGPLERIVTCCVREAGVWSPCAYGQITTLLGILFLINDKSTLNIAGVPPIQGLRQRGKKCVPAPFNSHPQETQNYNHKIIPCVTFSSLCHQLKPIVCILMVRIRSYA